MFKLIALAARIIVPCISITPVIAQVIQPIVSPDATPDVVATTGSSPFPSFDDYSWRSFIALNWPAMTGALNRGKPDRTKKFGDTQGPRVWATWKSRYEIFQPEGAEPSPWMKYEGQNPCGAGFSNDVLTLSSFSAFGDFNQAIFSLKDLGNPLVAQNETYIRYEVRVNQKEYNSIVDNKWYLAENLPTRDHPVPFNSGSTEIKAAWRILNEKDTPAVRSRYYIVRDAQVFDVDSRKCVLKDIALVGLHIVTKTPSRPQWIWSTFEHVDNVPAVTTEPKPPSDIPFSFNNSSNPQVLNPPQRPPAISVANPPLNQPTPMQVVRKQAIRSETMATNAAYWNLPEIRGTVWENYMLVMTQWPTQVTPEQPSNTGSPFPTNGSTLSNTTMETYFQFPGASCMDCHNISNREGRDFAMFVTLDAFRPSTLSPGDLFAAKIHGTLESQVESELDADPVVRSLGEFMNSSRKN